MKYIIYERYSDAQSLVCSTKFLFSHLGLECLTPSVPLADCGGYWARLVQKDDLLCNVAYNLALANEFNATLVFTEEDAYANALYAKSIIESSTQIMRNLETQYLHDFGLLYDSRVQMSYLPDLLNSIDIGRYISKKFTPFLSIVVRGAYQGHLPKSTNHRIYEQIDLKFIDSVLSHQYYAHLLQHNLDSAYYNTAKCFFDIADLGVDFILTHSLSQFDILDRDRLKLCKAYNRDNIDIPVLFLPQILLLAFGCEGDRLGFSYHKQKVGIF